MKNKLVIFLVLMNAMLLAQSPQLINYQGTARRTDGTPITNRVLGIKFEIWEGTIPGTAVALETQTIATNNLGLFSTQVGKGGATINNVNWQNGPHFLKVSIDTTGGTSNFIGTYSVQIVSVPFALHAQNVPSTYTNNVLTIGKNSFTLNSAASPSISTLGMITATNSGANYTLSVPNPTLSINSNSLSINGGNTVVIPSQIAQTISVLGALTVTNGVNSATISAPNPSLSLSGNSLSINGSNTITLPSTPNTSLVSSGAAITNTLATNSYSINVPNTTISANVNTITITQGTFVSTATVPASSNANIVTQGVLSNSVSGNNFTLSVPNPVLNSTVNVISITQGTAVSTVTVPISHTITGAGVASISPSSGSVFTITVPPPSLSNTLNVISISQGTAVSTVTLPASSVPTLAINGQSLSTVGGNTIILPAQTNQTISGTGIATAGSLTANSFSVNVPAPVLSNTLNVITITQGTAVSTVTVPISHTITGAGIASVSPLSGSLFTVTVPPPSLSNTLNVISISQGTAVSTVTLPASSVPTLAINGQSLSTVGGNTIILPAQTNQTISGTGIATAGTVSANSFSVNVPAPLLTNTLNVLTITQGTAVSTVTLPASSTPTLAINGQSLSTIGGNTIVLPAQTNQTISGTGIATAGTLSANSFSVNVPAPLLTNTLNVLTITQGTAVSTVTLPASSVPTLAINGQSLSTVGGNTIILPAQTNQTISGTGIATAGTVSANSFSVNVPAPLLTNTLNVLTITQGTAVSTVTLPASSVPTLAINGQSLSTVGGNTIILPAQTNQTISGTGIATAGTVSANTFSVNVPAPLLTNTLNVLTITQGTAVSTVTLPASSVPTLALNGQSLSTIGGNTIVLPAQTTQSISGSGIATAGSITANSFSVNVPAPLLTNTLNVLTITQGTAVSTVTLPASSLPTLAINGQSLSTIGGNTIVLPSQTTQSISGSGIATAGSITANSFSVNVPAPLLTNTLNVLTITQGTAVSTVTLPSASNASLVGSGAAIVSTLSANSYSIHVAQPSLSINNGSLSVNGTNTVIITPTLALNAGTLTVGANTNTIDIAPVLSGSGAVTVSGVFPNYTIYSTPSGSVSSQTTTVTGTGLATVNSTATNVYNVNVAAPVLSNTSNILSISQGTAVSTVTLPTAASQTISVQGVASVTNGLNSATVMVPNPLLTNTLNVLSITQGTAVSTVTLPAAIAPTLALNGSSLSTVGGNTIIIPAQTTQTITGTGIATAGTVVANSFSVNVPAPVLSNTSNVLAITQGTAVSTVTLPSAAAQTITALGGVATVTNGANSATITVPSSSISSNGNTLTLTNGTVVTTATVPTQASQTITALGGIATVTNGANSATITVPSSSISSNGNTLTLTNGTVVTTATVPSQASQTITALGGIATVTNGTNSATITVPSSSISSNGNTLTLTNGTVVTTATVPSQVAQTITPQGVATVTNGVNSATINVANPVLSNTANVLAINQGTAVSTVTLPAQVSQTVTTQGVATVTNGVNSTTINVAAPVLSNTANILAINQGTAVSTVTLPAQVTQTITTLGGIATVTNGANSATITVPSASISSSGNSLTLTNGTVVTTATVPLQTTQTVTGVGIINAGSVTANSFTVGIPNPTLSSTSNSISLTQGTVVTTATVPLQTTQTVTGVGIINAGSVTANSFTVGIPNPTLSSNSNSITLTQGTVVTTATVPLQTTQTVTGVGIINAGSVTANSFTVGIPNPTLSSTSNSITLTQGTVVTTATVPTQISQTVTPQGIATVTNGVNSTTINVAAPVLSNTANILAINQGTAVSTVTLPAQVTQTIVPQGAISVSTGVNIFTISSPAQVNQTISTLGVATVTNGSNSATITVPNPVLSNTANVLAINQGAAVSTVTLPAQVSQTISTQGVATVTNGVNTATINVANPVLSNTANVLAINQGTAVSTVTLPSQVSQTISTLGIATVTNGVNSATITVNQPTFAYSQTTGSLTSGTASALITPSVAIIGNTISVGPTSNSIAIPAQVTPTITGIGVTTVSSSGYSFTVNTPASSYNSSNGILSEGSNSINITPVIAFNATTDVITSGPASNSLDITGMGGWVHSATATAIYLTNITNSVGIGINPPTQKLDVVGNVKFSGALMPNNSAGTSGQYLVSAGTNSAPVWTSINSGTAAVWSVLGNVGTNTVSNFLGTTDDVPLTFRVNGQKAGIIENSSNGTNNTFFGYQSGLVNASPTGVNSAFGYWAMKANTTGHSNAAFGTFALSNNVGGAFNTAIGRQALSANSTNYNTAVGGYALIGNTTGIGNTALGFESGYTAVSANMNTTGSYNVFIGYDSGPSSTVQVSNAIAIGKNALVGSSNAMVLGGTGADAVKVGIGTVTPTEVLDVLGNVKFSGALMPNNTAGTAGQYLVSAGTNSAPVWTSINSGTSAVWSALGNSGTSTLTNFIGTTDNVPLNFRVNNLKSGTIDNTLQNVFLGASSGSAITTGSMNVGLGDNAMFSNTSGLNNVAVGNYALKDNTSGTGNTAIGSLAEKFNTTGINNTGVGYSALYNNGNGIANTAIGVTALYATANGASNTAVGYRAGYSNSTGSLNVFIGNSAGYFETGSNKLYISNSTTSTTPLIYGDFSTNKVAIGNVNATEALDVTGNVKFSGALMPGNAAGTTGQYLVSAGTNSAPVWTSIGTGTNTLWSTIGNAATSATANFIGTTDNVALSFRVNNQKSGTIDQTGPTFFGYQAGAANTETSNTGSGYQALMANTTGSFNTAIGYQSLSNNTTGYQNTATGFKALFSNTTGSLNTANGYLALSNNTTGYRNSAFGDNSLLSNTIGFFNTAVGYSALSGNLSGAWNTAVGYTALSNNLGSSNTAIGEAAISSITTGNNNVGIGESVLRNNISGSNNTALGTTAGYTNTGTGNVFLGYSAGYYETGSNKLYISNSTTSTTPLIYGDFSTGFLGLGTTTANADLQFDNAITSRKIVLWEGANNDNNVYGFGLASNTLKYQVDATTASHVFYAGTSATASQELFRIQGNKRIGINNAAPSATLDVLGTFKLTDGTQAAGRFLSTDALGNASWTAINSGTAGYWSALGNAGTTPSLNFIGTTDTQTLNFRVNNVKAGQIDGTLNNVFFGANTATAVTTGSNNVGIGDNALSSLTTGSANVAIGSSALALNTSGYFNTAVGSQALQSNTSGVANAAFGLNALGSNSSGGSNSAFGAYALIANTIGQSNSAFGRDALLSNSTGSFNSVFGALALDGNTNGSYNTAMGFNSLGSNTTGQFNSAYGSYALFSNSTGTAGSAFGYQTLYNNTSGDLNAGFGYQVLFNNTVGEQNTGAGYRALYANTTGSNNSAFGSQALQANLTGSNSSAFGDQALLNNTTGTHNDAFGRNALNSNTSGSYNIAIGNFVLASNTTGSRNVAIGSSAGNAITTGTGNVFLGNNAGFFETGSDKLYIENSNTTLPLIYGDFANERVSFGSSAPPNSMVTISISAQQTANAIGLTSTNNYTGAATKYGIDVNVDGAGSGTKFGISSSVIGLAADASPNYGYQVLMTPNGSGSVFGLYSAMTATGTGARYGLYNYVPMAAANTSQNMGIYNYAIKQSGSTLGSNYGIQNWADNYANGVNYGIYSNAFGGSTSYGIFSSASGATTNYAGYFSGNVFVNGTLSKSAGTFKIDHPQDPENKYLIHSFVESPDMMNVYNGNVVTDVNGVATVTLPSYFEAENINFRYQLTAIGQSAQVFILEEIANNAFKIKSDKPGVKVSWQVTGVRNDEYAKQNRIVPEVEKSQADKGKYLNPELYGKGNESAIHPIPEKPATVDQPTNEDDSVPEIPATVNETNTISEPH